MEIETYCKIVGATKEIVKEMLMKGKKEILVSKNSKTLARSPAKKGGSLQNLAVEVETCKKCQLGYSRIKSVFGAGFSSARAMFIGEGPGYEEDRQGLPFVGRAGKLLDDMMKAIELNRENSYIANVVKCHPMIDPEHPEKRGNDRPPSAEEAEKCLPYLKKQIELINPDVLCILGSTAMKFVLGITDPIGGVRGRWVEFEGRKAIVTYHPAALLRNPSLKIKSWADLKLLRDELKKTPEK